MTARLLPGPTRSAAPIPRPSRRSAGPPAGSRRVLTPADMPPMPYLRFFVAADACVVVRPAVDVAAIARVDASAQIDVALSASVRADGGTKYVDADAVVELTASAAAWVKLRRTVTATLEVSATAVAGVGVRPNAAFTVSASADSVATAFVSAAQSTGVTATADVVAIGGQIPVDAVQTITVTAAASRVARIPIAASVLIAVTAVVERVIRMAANAIQVATVSATAAAVGRLRVAAQATATVTATATARPSFAAQGMDKTGNQTPSTTLAKLVGFTVRSGSSVVDDGLVVVGAGTALIEGSVNFSNGASATHNARVYLNGSMLANGPTLSGTGIGTVSVAAQPLVAGDVLELWAFSNLTSRTNVAAASTFLTITPVT